jgi:hypothetical protein
MKIRKKKKKSIYDRCSGRMRERERIEIRMNTQKLNQISHRMNTLKLNPKLKSTTFNQILNHAYMVEDERA